MARPEPGPGPEVRALAERPEVRHAIQFVARERAWISQQHLTICRVAAPTFFEQRRAAHVHELFESFGLESKIDRAGNVVASRRNEKSRELVAMTAHLDTVLAPRVPEDITVTHEGRFVGPGVSDNGAGLAALVTLARLAAEWPQTGGPGLVFVANVGEEGEGNLSGMRYLCEQSGLSRRLKRIVVIDGPNLEHITNQALASRRFEVTITGTGGHSWSDAGTANAAHALARLVTLFSDHRSLEGRTERFSFNFGILEAGSNVTSIPALARTKVDLRSEDPAMLTELALLLQSSLERALEIENARSRGPRVTARIKEIGSRPGGKVPEDSTVLRSIRAVDGYLGLRSRLDCSSTDANIPIAMGLDAVSVGAGGTGGGAHTPAEWYHPDGRETGLRRLILTLSALLYTA